MIVLAAVNDLRDILEHPAIEIIPVFFITVHLWRLPSRLFNLLLKLQWPNLPVLRKELLNLVQKLLVDFEHELEGSPVDFAEFFAVDHEQDQ